MSENALRKRLSAGKALLGLANSFPAAAVIEAMCPGYDFVWIDGQHGQHDYRSLLENIRTAALVGCPVLLRVPAGNDPCLGKYLDMDPEAVLAPMINSPELAKGFVEAVRYPPAGQRSAGGPRMLARYGGNFPAEADVLAVGQIETPEALAAVAEIAAVEGLDGLFLGPGDLALGMGLPVGTGVLGAPRLTVAVKTIADAAHDAGKFVVGIGRDEATFDLYRDCGYEMIVVGSDTQFVMSGAAAARERFRERLGGKG